MRRVNIKIFVIVAFILSVQPVFADVNCTVESGWSLQFNSGNTPQFEEVYQLLQSGDLSDADVEIQQVYMSPGEFKARVLFDGQNTHIRTELSSRNGEYAVYTGTLDIEGKLQTVVCNQN
jgi:hypothetical protein